MNRQHHHTAVSNKVTIRHLERLAYVYVRQSSPKQVERNRESQVYQYQLSQRAQELGWSADRVRVIDADLGLSGRDSQYRDGFQELVAEVSLGHVGIIFGYEVSRLARNNRDWYHLLDLASVFGTLIADADGVYDPRLYNDRLLLGLKGTMSEAELHLLKMRLEAGRLNQVRRGEYHQALPTGFLRLPDGRAVKDPDEQICRTIELVFSKFQELGSSRKVLRYFKREGILLPRRYPVGRNAGELHWKEATDHALLSILHNPTYAGAFAYGRRQMDPSLRTPQSEHIGRTHRREEEWVHLQQNVYPAFISWEQYQRNQERLLENSSLMMRREENGRGPVREGAALLQGLAICGECGAKMRVAYKTNSHRYQCVIRAHRFEGKWCASLYGKSIDEAVAAAFLSAIEPAQLDALDAVLKQQAGEQARLEKHWQDQIKRAEYEARLSQRQFDAADPDNRLVTAELERRWEEKLKVLRQAQEDYLRFQQRPSKTGLMREQREQFQHLSKWLPIFWRESRLSFEQKKELLRSLITRVILKRLGPDRQEARIVWVSGHYTILQIRPMIYSDRDVACYEAMVERVQQLWQSGAMSDIEIAAQLSAEGFYSARSEGVSATSVQKIRLGRKWYSAYHRSRNAATVDGYLTVKGLAARLGVGRRRIYHIIEQGKFGPDQIIRHPQGNAWLIRDEENVIKQFQQTEHQKSRP